MKTTRGLYRRIAVAGVAVVLAACAAQMNSQPGVSIGSNDLGGVVASARGPKAASLEDEKQREAHS